MIIAAPIPDDIDALPWQSADGAAIDRAAAYCVETNDGQVEVWSGALLHVRMRPAFVVGRAVHVAKLEPEACA